MFGIANHNYFLLNGGHPGNSVFSYLFCIQLFPIFDWPKELQFILKNAVKSKFFMKKVQ